MAKKKGNTSKAYKDKRARYWAKKPKIEEAKLAMRLEQTIPKTGNPDKHRHKWNLLASSKKCQICPLTKKRIKKSKHANRKEEIT